MLRLGSDNDVVGPEVSFALRALMAQLVPAGRIAMRDLAGGGHLESLFHPFMGLLLWHQSTSRSPPSRKVVLGRGRSRK